MYVFIYFMPRLGHRVYWATRSFRDHDWLLLCVTGVELGELPQTIDLQYTIVVRYRARHATLATVNFATICTRWPQADSLMQCAYTGYRPTADQCITLSFTVGGSAVALRSGSLCRRRSAKRGAPKAATKYPWRNGLRVIFNQQWIPIFRLKSLIDYFSYKLNVEKWRNVGDALEHFNFNGVSSWFARRSLTQLPKSEPKIDNCFYSCIRLGYCE